MIMQKKITLLITLLLVSFSPVMANVTRPDYPQRKALVEDMMQRSRWGDACYLLDRMAEQLDEQMDAYEMEWVDFQRIQCNVELGTAEVDEMMMRFTEKYPQSRYNNSVLYLLGSYYCDEGDFERAEKIYELVEYKHLDAHQKERYDIRMGYIYFVDGRYAEAEPYFSRIAANSEYYQHPLFFLSYIAYINKEYDVAEQGFKKLQSYDDYAALVPFYLLQIEYRKGNYDYVISNGESLLEPASDEERPSDDASDDLVRVLAESYFAIGDYAQAKRYISQYPKELMGRQEYYILGYSLYRLALYDQAIAPLKEVCGKPDELTQNASYYLGDCFLKEGDKVQAANAFSMASVEGFDDKIAEYSLLNYGRLKYELGGGTFNEAVSVLQSYIERYPDSPYIPEVKTILIAAYHNSQNYDSTYTAIKELQNPDGEIKKTLQRVSILRAIEAIKSGDWDTADVLLKESEQLNIDARYTALTSYWQGEVAYAKGDMQLAKQKYSDYIRRVPRNSNDIEIGMAHYGAGYANLGLEDMQSAETSFETFVRDYAYRDSYMYDAHNRLGDARYVMRKFSSARDAYNISAVAETPERHYARYQLAMIDGIESKTDNKINRLKNIVMDGEGDYVDDAWYELGCTYMGGQRFEEGATTFQEFVDVDTLSPYHVDALFNLGLAYFNLGRMDEARRSYERVVAYDAQSSKAMEAMRSIREIYVTEGNIDEYFAYAERCGVQSDMSVVTRDSLTFAAAKSIYFEGNKVVATSKLKNYLDSFTNGYNRSEALYYLSDCHIQAEDYTSAMTTLEELLSHGNTTYTERALTVYAPMALDLEQYDKSATAYRRLYDVSADMDKRAMAADGYVEATLFTDDAERIKSMADDIAAMPDVSPWARRSSSLAKANILSNEGEKEQALKIYAHLAEDRTTIEGAEAYYYMIQDMFDRGDYATAEQMVYDMGKCGSMYWQAKCFIVLGDVFVKLDNSFQARATYQSIVDGYTIKDDGIVEEAQQRINSLK